MPRCDLLFEKTKDEAGQPGSVATSRAETLHAGANFKISIPGGIVDTNSLAYAEVPLTGGANIFRLRCWSSNAVTYSRYTDGPDDFHS